MKHSLSTLKITIACAMLALCMTPGIGWSTRLLESVNGQVTSLMGTGEIQAGGRTYHVKSGSAAEKALSKLSTGQQVRAVLDGPPGDSKSQVISVTVIETHGE